MTMTVPVVHQQSVVHQHRVSCISIESVASGHARVRRRYHSVVGVLAEDGDATASNHPNCKVSVDRVTTMVFHQQSPNFGNSPHVSKNCSSMCARARANDYRSSAWESTIVLRSKNLLIYIARVCRQTLSTTDRLSIGLSSWVVRRSCGLASQVRVRAG